MLISLEILHVHQVYSPLPTFQASPIFRMLPLSFLLTLLSSIFLFTSAIPVKRVRVVLLNSYAKQYTFNNPQGFAPDQYGPSVLHKRPFCNAFSGCGSGKRLSDHHPCFCNVIMIIEILIIVFITTTAFFMDTFSKVRPKHR